MSSVTSPISNAPSLHSTRQKRNFPQERYRSLSTQQSDTYLSAARNCIHSRITKMPLPALNLVVLKVQRLWMNDCSIIPPYSLAAETPIQQSLHYLQFQSPVYTNVSHFKP
eukprot:scaffold2612_cov132-Skeletonema_menzelii.AAC.16